MKILVTGSSGLLGSNLVLEACNEGYDVVAAYNSHAICFPNVTNIKLDLLSEANVLIQIVTDINPDWIIHCAAYTDVDGCENQPDLAHQLNIQTTENLLNCARGLECGLVYISTDSVFDGLKGLYKEIDIPNPLNVYARTKLIAEQSVLEYEKGLILRTNIFGWNVQNKMSLAEWVLNKLEKKEVFPAFTDVYFSPLLVNNLSEMILLAIDNQLSGLFHIGSSDYLSKYQFALQIADIFNLASNNIRPTSIDECTLLAKRPKNMSLDSSKFQQICNIKLSDVKQELTKFKYYQDVGYNSQLKQYLEERR